MAFVQGGIKQDASHGDSTIIFLWLNCIHPGTTQQLFLDSHNELQLILKVLAHIVLIVLILNFIFQYNINQFCGGGNRHL